MARHAIALDPNDAEAHAALAYSSLRSGRVYLPMNFVAGLKRRSVFRAAALCIGAARAEWSRSSKAAWAKQPAWDPLRKDPRFQALFVENPNHGPAVPHE